jgi:hypothetical protein
MTPTFVRSVQRSDGGWPIRRVARSRRFAAYWRSGVLFRQA